MSSNSIFYIPTRVGWASPDFIVEITIIYVFELLDKWIVS